MCDIVGAVIKCFTEFYYALCNLCFTIHTAQKTGKNVLDDSRNFFSLYYIL